MGISLKQLLWLLAIAFGLASFCCGNLENQCNFEESSYEYRWIQCSPTAEKNCSALGCCFNTTSTECIKRIKRSSEIKNGTCLQYTGSLCADAFNKTNVLHSNRLFDVKYLMNGTEAILEGLFKIFESLKNMRAECKEILKTSACPFVMPECRKNKTLKSCREDCEHVFKKCGGDSERALGAIEIQLGQRGLDFYHLAVPSTSCEEYPWSYDVGDNCMHIFPGIDRSPPKKELNTTAIIGGAVAGAVMVLLIIAIAYCRHKRKKRKDLIQAEMDFVSNMTSIREHIRNGDNTINPLTELLASSKPGELIQYPVDCIEYVKELGEGQFGKVFQGRVHGVVKGEESTDVAVKCLKEGSSEVAKASFNQEVALMSVLQHPNILRLLAVSTEEEPYCMIFEFMEKGDLNEFLRQWNSKDSLNDSQLIKMCKHISNGMEYLASKRFLHRDLATRNCLVGNDLMVKIADFGMSRNVYHSDYYRVGGEAMLPIRWMPPESILYGKFTVASDVYSFGVVMWEVFSFALQPFYGYSNEEVIEFIKKGVLLPKPEDCPEWIYNIMLACWKRDPEDRISFTKALQILKGKVDDNHETDQSYDTSNYDQVPATNRPVDDTTNIEEGYNKVTTSQQQQPSNYDKVWNETPPSYINLQYQDKAEKQKPQIIENVTKSNDDNSTPSSPTEPGSPNMAFDDDEKSLLKARSTSSLPKGSPSLKAKISSLTPQRTKKLTSKDFPTNEELYRKRSQGRRSIKEVMKDGPRYVCSDDIKRISQVSDDKNQEELSNEEESRGYECAFRPTSEFLPYHGYGESIQSTDPDEAKLIKKIIEEGK